VKIFLDSANLDDVRMLVALGLCDGVTTNPTLVAKQKNSEGLDFRGTIREIARLVGGPVSAEVVAVDVPGMLAEARVLAAIDHHVVVKLPLTREGLQVCRELRNEGIATNVTLCFQAGQALLAAKAGATYISPFVGRLDDLGCNGMQLVRDIRQIYDRYGFTTKILAASIRHPQHVVDAAMSGADVVTAPLAPILALFNHPLTDKGLATFLADWKASGLNHITG
jgi:transaldolase